MHMAPAAARGAGAHGAWSLSSPGLLSSNHVLLSSPDAATAASATVRFTRGTGGRRTVLCLASGGGPPRDGEWDPTDSSWDGRLVDEGMATLRRRIREAKAASTEPEEDEDEEEEGGVLVDGDGLPGEWTELERRHHGSYVAGVRILQEFLMRARPGLGAGVVALVLLSVPATVLLVAARLIQAVYSISSAVMNGRM